MELKGLKMKKILYPCLVAVYLLTNAWSCREKEPPATISKGVSVYSIEAEGNFDLSQRKDWVLTIESIRYDAAIEGNKLTGTSKNKPYEFSPGVEVGSVRVLFYPPNYGRTRDEASMPPIIEDQSTLEKFIKCDPLSTSYAGKVGENLKGITLYHYNALLSFEVNDLPEGAKVFIEQTHSQKVTPLRSAGNPEAYKAIVFPYNQDVALRVETPHGIYRTPVLGNGGRTRMPIHPEGIGSSALVTFNACINEENELVIENLNRKAWCKEWPIEY